jgi:YfiH family protein
MGQDNFSLGYGRSLPAEQITANRHSFSEALGQGPIHDLRAEPDFPQDISSGQFLVSVRQTHSQLVHLSGRPNLRDFPREGDGLITREPGLFLSVLTADCMPVVLANPWKPAIAVVHAGWRGAAEGIIPHTLDLMLRHFSSRPSECLALVGPSIRGCCYQVGSEVAERFMRESGEAGAFLLADPSTPGKYRLDLPSYGRHQLIQAGLQPENVWADPPCTCCRQDLFFSHRGSRGNAGRMMALAGIHSIQSVAVS